MEFLRSKFLFLILAFTLIGCDGEILEKLDHDVEAGQFCPFSRLPDGTCPGANNTVSKTWDFSTPSDYTYDTNYVEIASGNASLKTVDTNHSGTDFNSGGHMGTQISGGKITIDTSGTQNIDASWTPQYSSIVAHYAFENTWVDSINGYDITPASASFSTDKAVGTHSASLVSTTASIANTADLNFGASTDFTIVFWFKSSDSSGAFFEWSGGTPYLTLNFDVGRIRPRLRDLSSNTSDTYHGTVNEFNDNQWHHAVLSFDRDGDLNVYVDGSREGASVDISGIGNLDTGLGYVFGDNYDGLIDDFTIWRGKALNEFEALNLYNRQTSNYFSSTSLDASWTPKYSDLVGYWKMDGNWQDSVGSNHGVANGNATFDNDMKIGSQAGVFDGNNDYIEVPDDSSLDITTDITTAFWIKTITASSTVPLSKYDSGGDRGWVYSIAPAGTVQFDGRDGTGTYHSSTASTTKINDGLWHFIVGKREGNIWSIYVDGKEEQSNDVGGAGSLANNFPLRVGINSGPLNYDLNGKVDDVTVWSTSLTDQDISLIYNRQKQKYAGSYESPVIDTGSTSASWSDLNWVTELPFMKELPGSAGSESSAGYVSLVGSTGSMNDDDLMVDLEGLWHFNETGATAGVNNDFQDYSGNSRHGEQNGSISFGVEGILNKSAKLNGSTDHIRVNNLILGALQDFTVSTWVKFDSSSPSKLENIFSQSSNTFQIVVFSNGGLGSHLTNNVGWHGSATSAAFTDWDQWHHIIARYSINGLELFRDGVRVVNDTDETGTVNLSATTYFGSKNGSAERFTGQVDEYAVWSRALHDDEITQLYRRGANRLKLQVRSCDDSSCSGEEWQGPDNTNGEFYFSELHNCDVLVPRLSNGNCDYAGGDLVKLGSPDYDFADFLGLSVPANRYFQYRVLMESDDESVTPTFPSLTSISPGDTKYYGGSPDIVTTSGQSFSSWTSFSATTSGSCTPTYQVSLDKVTWYYHNGAFWVVAASSVNSNTEADISSNASTFASDVGSGTIFFKAFLNSDTTQTCSISDITASGKK